MQPKSTQSILWSFCRKVIAIVAIIMAVAYPSHSQTELFNEGFTTVVPAGWAQQNLSTPVGTDPTWSQGIPAPNLWDAHSGPADSYARADYLNVDGANTISNWLFTPSVLLTNGDIFSFWTRTVDVPGFADRLQVRLSTNGASVDVGATNTSVGDFTTVLLDINPTYDLTSYPTVWTLKTITISGLAAPIQGRIAFRYFVEDGGPQGTNSDNIGIDDAIYFQSVTPACSGTPNPGNTIATAASVCPGSLVSLSVQNVINGSGVTYQWQSGPSATGPFTDIAGATTNAYQTTITADTYFQLIAICAGTPGTSTPVLVALTPPSGCYCIPLADCSFDDYIANVKMGGIDNTSACAASGYTNYTGAVPPIEAVSGAPNPISVEVGPGGNEYVTAWIDYNHNGTFDDTEYALIGNANGAVINGSINIPSTAMTGLTRLRLRVRYNIANPNTGACIDNVFGEVEDYAINITPCIPGVINTDPSSAAVSCGQGVSFTADAVGSYLTYQWQQRTSATALWTTVVDGTGVSGALTNTLTLSSVVESMSGYQYRVLISGGCTATDFSDIATLTVTPLVIEVDPVSYASCTPIPAGSPIPLNITSQNGVITTTTVSFASAALNTTIPDGDDAGIINAVTVAGIPAGATIISASVKLNIAHTWIGDLVVALKAPNNNVLNLDYGLTQTGGAAPTTGFTNTIISSTGTNTLLSGTDPWTGTFAPDAPQTPGTVPTAPTNLSASNANVFTFADLYSVPNGNWTIGLFDYLAPDEGTFINWELTLTYSVSVTTAYTGVWSPVTGLFTDAAGTIPYTGTEESTVYAAPAAATNYTVTVNSAPCVSAPVVIPFTFGTPIGAIVDQPQDVTACVGETVSFSSDVAPGSSASYQWQESADGGLTFTDIGGANTNTLTLTDIPASANSYQYHLVVSSATCSGSVTSDAATLTVNAPPAVTVTAAPFTHLYPGLQTMLTANVTPATSDDVFQWFFQGTAIPGATSNQYIASFANYGIGDYSVDVSNPVLCSGKVSAGITLTDSLTSNIFIWPNPNNGQFQVRFDNGANDLLQKPKVITIYDSKGSRVFSKTYVVGVPYGRMDVDLRREPKGVYVIELTDDKGARLQTGRVLVQ